MLPDTEAGLLTPEQFINYQAAWVSLVQSASSEQLQALFTSPAGQLQSFVSIGSQQLVWLLSTPNLHQVRTRFVLLPATDPQQPRFSIALYVTDKDNQRLSAYYLADAQWPATGPDTTEPLPQTLADTWLANWQTTTVTATQFTTSYGPLEGYNFQVADFIDTLLSVKSLKEVTLRLNFGLHCYYAPTEQPELAQLFALVLRLNVPGSASAFEEPFYDLGTSCPPG